MKHLVLRAALLAALAFGGVAATSPAFAGCYADYKAKQGNPLKLHYGVIQLPDGACDSIAMARPMVAARIAKGGWTLLAVIAIFGEDGLAKRRASAGAYYLRY